MHNVTQFKIPHVIFIIYYRILWNTPDSHSSLTAFSQNLTITLPHAPTALSQLSHNSPTCSNSSMTLNPRLSHILPQLSHTERSSRSYAKTGLRKSGGSGRRGQWDRAVPEGWRISKIIQAVFLTFILYLKSHFFSAPWGGFRGPARLI